MAKKTEQIKHLGRIKRLFEQIKVKTVGVQRAVIIPSKKDKTTSPKKQRKRKDWLKPEV